MSSKVPTRPFRPGDEKSVPLAPPTPTTDSCPSLEKFEINEKSSLDEGVPSHELADLKNIVNPARKLNRKQLGLQRSVFILFVLCVNIGLGYVATRVYHGAFILAFIVFVKAKDFTYASISMIGLIVQKTYRYFNPPEPVTRKWILSLIPAYSESEEQILKCITSLQTNGAAPHRQVMVVLLDGNPRDIRSHMTRVILEIERPYVSLKYKLSSLKVTAGWIGDAPVIVLEKSKNSGKKDSLVLCHDIFNFPRSNMPILTKILKEEIWRDVLPAFTNGEGFNGFDMVFCTDADSIVHKGAIAHLANAMARDEKAIAACGLVLVELEPGYEWSFWNLFQQVQVPSRIQIPQVNSNICNQYTYGQFIRRRAEGFIGRVTCLPGCVTMTAVRKEMAGAIQKYAEPVTAYSVLHHQVQYLVSFQFIYCETSSLTSSPRAQIGVLPIACYLKVPTYTPSSCPRPSARLLRRNRSNITSVSAADGAQMRTSTTSSTAGALK